MAYCDVCGNFDDEHTDGEPEIKALEGCCYDVGYII